MAEQNNAQRVQATQNNVNLSSSSRPAQPNVEHISLVDVKAEHVGIALNRTLDGKQIDYGKDYVVTAEGTYAKYGWDKEKQQKDLDDIQYYVFNCYDLEDANYFLSKGKSLNLVTALSIFVPCSSSNDEIFEGVKNETITRVHFDSLFAKPVARYNQYPTNISAYVVLQIWANSVTKLA